MNTVSGFSKMSKTEKINWLAGQFQGDEAQVIHDMERFWNQNPEASKTMHDFIKV